MYYEIQQAWSDVDFPINEEFLRNKAILLEQKYYYYGKPEIIQPPCEEKSPLEMHVAPVSTEPEHLATTSASPTSE